MSKLVFISILSAILLVPLSVQADHRNHEGHGRHGAKHHYVHNFDRYGHGHRPHARLAHRGKHYVHPHHRGRKHGHSYRPSHYDDGGHWGIVIRYFD